MGIIFWQSAVVQPRAMARRHALEAARDPVAAARRRRRERLQCRIGLISARSAVSGAARRAVASGRHLTF
jgi:hypothetical protein